MPPFTEFIKHIYQINTDWKGKEMKGIKILRNKDIKTLWFADGHF